MQKDNLRTLISVVIPSFNAADILPTTLRSVMTELGPSDEVVIVDDGSSDDTEAVVSTFGDGRIRYVHQANSGGPASPRNHGIGLARGELVFLFDSDDLMLPGKIAAVKNAYQENQDAGLFFSNFKTINDAEETLNPRFLDDYEFIAPFSDSTEFVRFEPPEAYRAQARENFIGTSGVAIPKAVLDVVGPFDETLRNGDDRDMWFRLTRKYPVVYIPHVHHCYRIGEGSISTGNAHKRTPAKLKVLERQLEDPLDQAFINDVRKLIADNYHALAYESFSLGRMGDCRAEVLNGWKAQRRLVWVKLWALSLLGARLTSGLRQLKRSLAR